EEAYLGRGRLRGGQRCDSREEKAMSGFPWQPRPTFPPATWGLVLLVAGLVVLALGGLLFVLALTGGNSRVTSEAYIYNLFVRVRNPGAIAALLCPLPVL